MDHDMKKNTSKQYAIALYETTKELSGRDLEQAIQNFVTLLVHDRKLRQADAIIREFEAYAKKQDGVVGIEITSARKLDKATLNLITKAFGEKVEAVESVDEGLIGGMRVKMEDRILDGSIRTHLMRLKQQLA
ncbi:MAG: ATP synthase F1 subunit delta [Candidatus Magasanikbacteria bacterium RIFCSPHIGHO2_02_FULL_51_14]|uniref:ATP synthase subunit delta n=1 Tax=Candidatus Magasanikbacteria bacterium RIFCSPHIGHO2_02_FULL_51_14 TaxID=1798683 RepID=A0A1F6MEP4_9BACT|nr:MAG: ATP synthase F1 subunit delta [Candidatus Magasanikbacteria bacterium RIFCSPHIGHO2_02_FULL_51_14]